MILKIFYRILDTIQVFNKVLQGTPIPQHRVLFFLDRFHGKTRTDKWEQFFKFLLRHYILNKIGDLLYQGLFHAGLKEYYLDIATEQGNHYLWPKGNILSIHIVNCLVHYKNMNSKNRIPTTYNLIHHKYIHPIGHFITATEWYKDPLFYQDFLYCCPFNKFLLEQFQLHMAISTIDNAYHPRYYMNIRKERHITLTQRSLTPTQ